MRGEAVDVQQQTLDGEVSLTQLHDVAAQIFLDIHRV